MTLLMTWDMLFITYCHAELQTQTCALCLTGTINTPSKVIKEIKEQDTDLAIIFCHSALLFHRQKILCYQLEIMFKSLI